MEPSNDFLDNLGNNNYKKYLIEITNEDVKDDEDLKPQNLIEEYNQK